MKKYCFSIAGYKDKECKGPIVRYCQHGRYWHNRLFVYCLLRNRRLSKNFYWKAIDEHTGEQVRG